MGTNRFTSFHNYPRFPARVEGVSILTIYLNLLACSQKGTSFGEYLAPLKLFQGFRYPPKRVTYLAVLRNPCGIVSICEQFSRFK
jgi:hypothetical protein